MAPTMTLQTERGLVTAIIGGDSRLSYRKVERALGLRDASLARPDVVRLRPARRSGLSRP